MTSGGPADGPDPEGHRDFLPNASHGFTVAASAPPRISGTAHVNALPASRSLPLSILVAR